MTDNEIKKALECCRTNIMADCKRCNLRLEDGTTRPYCTTILIGNALDLINRLQVENERLKKELETEKNQVIRLESQIGRLLSMNQAKLDTIHDLQEENNWYNETLNTTKAEAYKEFAERFKSIAGIYQKDTYVIGVDEFDNLLKEFGSGDNASLDNKN